MNYRGSSAIHGAVDAPILSESSGNQITLICKAMKHARAFDPVTVQWDNVQIETEEEGWQESFAITKRVETRAHLDQVIKETKQHARELVEIMLKHFPDGATNADLRKQSQMSKGTFDRALQCCAVENKWFVGGGRSRQALQLKPGRILEG
jgi:rubrerythrin